MSPQSPSRWLAEALVQYQPPVRALRLNRAARRQHRLHLLAQRGPASEPSFEYGAAHREAPDARVGQASDPLLAVHTASDDYRDVDRPDHRPYQRAHIAVVAVGEQIEAAYALHDS